MGIWPLLLCIIYCATYGKTLGDIYLPNSSWNDELFYYKQVEGILKGGVPGGYFGFNESRAQIFSFAAWSPVLLIHWVLGGLLFGWNFFSPILCNLICMMAGMAIFAWLAKPTAKQAFVLMSLFTVFSMYTRYILSCMPEALCWSLTLWYMGCLFAFQENRKSKYLWQMYGIAGFLTLARPYFLIFIIYPIIALKKDYKIKYITVIGGVFFIAAYFVLYRFFCADYFSGIMDDSFLTILKESGLSACINALYERILSIVHELRILLWAARNNGYFSGSFYAIYGLTGLCFLFIAAIDNMK